MARVLNISPDTEVRTLRAVVLRLNGGDVISVTTKKDAVAKMESDRFDLLVMGFRLSERSLLELSRKFKQRNPKGCVLFIAKYDVPSTVRSHLDVVVHALDGPEKLLRAIRELCPPLIRGA